MFGRSGGRSRWAAVGVAALLLGGSGLLTASAGSPGTASVLVPITPCRLIDTRTAPDTVGARNTPLGPQTTYTASAWGTNGNCTIPSVATALSMNVTSVGPTAASFLTVFPADAAKPQASSLNWVAGQAPTPNAVTAPLSADGKVSFFNLSGDVNLIVDVVGYYQPSISGPPGPHPAQVVWVAQSGGDFTSVNAALASITDNSAAKPYLVKIAPGIYVETRVFVKDYVDLEGSGQDISTITCACGGTGFSYLSATMAALDAALHSEIHDLSVVNTGASNDAVAIATGSVTQNVSFDHVTATASGGALLNVGFLVDGSPSASPTLTNVTATGTGGAQDAAGIVFNSASSSTVINVTAIGALGLRSWGVVLSGGTVIIRDSFLSGTTNSVFNGVGTVHIADTVVVGPTAGVGAANCVDVITAALASYTCA